MCGLNDPSSPGDPEPPSLSGPALSRGGLRMGGLSWVEVHGGEGPGRDGRQGLWFWRAVSCWLRGLTAKEGGFRAAPHVCQEARPSFGDLLPGPLGPPWGGSGPE